MKKILLSKLRAMGDTVLLSATLEECKRLFPKDQIHLLIPEAWKALYNHDPRPTKVWTFDTRLTGWRKTKAFFELARELRHLDVDISLGCHASPTSSWLGFLSGAQTRAHHNHNFLEPNKLGNVDIPGKEILKPFVARDLAVLRALEKEVDPTVKTKIYVSADIHNWAVKEVERLGLREPLLGLGLGASRSTKIWPMESFGEVSKEWVRQSGGSVLSLLSPSERHLGEEWLSQVGSISGNQSFAVGSGYTLEETMGLISLCDVFLGNDSGPRHLAAAAGVRTVTLYGPQDPFECHPYDPKDHPYFFIDNLKCRPNTDLQGKHPWCGIEVCEVEKHKCMKDLAAPPVFEKVLEILKLQH
jgi:ADP-heptose:LPS heptosyltransferase